MGEPSPEAVLKLKAPTPGYLCPLSANTFGVEFLSFDIRDYETKEVVYMSPRELPEELPPNLTEDMLRSVRYTFPKQFLSYRTVRTALEFKVGDQPLSDFRMIELHYFKDQLIKTYDFSFGFCIPSSTNTWEAIYDLPVNSQAKINDYVNSPFAHKSDSFYFVGPKLIMHNKAEYQYV